VLWFRCCSIALSPFHSTYNSIPASNVGELAWGLAFLLSGFSLRINRRWVWLSNLKVNYAKTEHSSCCFTLSALSNVQSHWLTKLARRWRLWKRPKLVRQVWPLSVDTFPFALLWLVVKDQLCCYIIFAVLKTGQECLGICIKRGFNVKFVFPQVTVVYQYGDWYTTDLCYIRVQQIGACPYSCFLVVSDVRTSPLEAYVIHLRRIRYN